MRDCLWGELLRLHCSSCPEHNCIEVIPLNPHNLNNAPLHIQVATPQDQLHLVMVTVVPPIMVSGVVM